MCTNTVLGTLTRLISTITLQDQCLIREHKVLERLLHARFCCEPLHILPHLI